MKKIFGSIFAIVCLLFASVFLRGFHLTNTGLNQTTSSSHTGSAIESTPEPVAPSTLPITDTTTPYTTEPVATDPAETEHVHSYTQTYQPATCVENGFETHTCACGDSYESTIKAFGHEFSEYTSNNNATCEWDGTKSSKCSRCDAVDTVKDKGIFSRIEGVRI